VSNLGLRVMKLKFILLISAFCALFEAHATKPRLIVNIVVGSMRAEDLNRYASNFSEGGFKRLMIGGTVYTDSGYDYQQTTTPVSLATLSTGAMPSTHGVIGARWMDYTTNQSVELISSTENPSPEQLIAPTISET